MTGVTDTQHDASSSARGYDDTSLFCVQYTNNNNHVVVLLLLYYYNNYYYYYY